MGCVLTCPDVFKQLTCTRNQKPSLAICFEVFLGLSMMFMYLFFVCHHVIICTMPQLKSIYRIKSQRKWSGPNNFRGVSALQLVLLLLYSKHQIGVSLTPNNYDIWNAVQRTSTASRKRSGPCIQGAPVLVHPVVCCRFVWLSKHSINIILVPFFDCTFLAWQKNPAKRLFTFSFVWKRIGFKGTPRWPTVRFIPPSPTSTIPYFLFLAYHGNPTVGGG